jgi:hypothetical protein
MTHEECVLKALDKGKVSRDKFEEMTLNHLLSVCELMVSKNVIVF